MPDPRLNIPPPLEETASGIGILCHEWADLEQSICGSLVWAARIQSGANSKAIVRCFDFRDQLAALKMALVTRVKNEQAIDALFQSIDYIDNTLRIRRNRYVHDLWFLGDMPDREGIQVFRSSYTAKIFRPQAKQPRALKFDMRHELLDDMIQTVEEIRLHRAFIITVIDRLKRGRGMAGLLSELPPRHFLPRPEEKQNQMGSGPAKRQRPPRSSRGKSQPQ